MVFNPEGERGAGEELVMANPRIISSSRKQEAGEEGCLSFLKLNSNQLILADVERHVNIKVEAQDADGNKFQRTFTDWTARIFQHEYDHLQGTLFPDRISKNAKKAIVPFLKELEEHWQATHRDT
jgi:peptide deformylase